MHSENRSGFVAFDVVSAVDCVVVLVVLDSRIVVDFLVNFLRQEQKVK